MQPDRPARGTRSAACRGEPCRRDAAAPGPIAWATYAGHRFARELDEPDIGDALPFRREVTALAMQHLTDMRIREGAHLRDDLQVHLDAAAALREQIASRAPQVVEEYRLRLTERLARLPIEPVDPARLAQEVALMADKCAIDEELSRLESHIAQMHVYLDVSGETGKKMDFLIQEMNREANTIGSKCSDAQMAQNVVNLKSEIEKMREQIQNAV